MRSRQEVDGHLGRLTVLSPGRVGVALGAFGAWGAREASGIWGAFLAAAGGAGRGLGGASPGRFLRLLTWGGGGGGGGKRRSRWGRGGAGGERRR